MSIQNVLVLGGSGFLGRHIIEELNNKGVQAFCLENKSRVHIQNDNIKVIKGSFLDFQWEKLGEVNLQVIFHTARVSGSNMKSRRQAAFENAKANEKLIKWLKTLYTPPLLVFVSGSLVYGSHHNMSIDENQPPNPTSFQREYFMAEQPILHAFERKETPVQIVMPSWI